MYGKSCSGPWVEASDDVWDRVSLGSMLLNNLGWQCVWMRRNTVVIKTNQDIRRLGPEAEQEVISPKRSTVLYSSQNFCAKMNMRLFGVMTWILDSFWNKAENFWRPMRAHPLNVIAPPGCDWMWRFRPCIRFFFVCMRTLKLYPSERPIKHKWDFAGRKGFLWSAMR